MLKINKLVNKISRKLQISRLFNICQQLISDMKLLDHYLIIKRFKSSKNLIKTKTRIQN